MLGVDLQISGAGLVNFVFTKWLRPTYADQNYAIFAFNSLNLYLYFKATPKFDSDITYYTLQTLIYFLKGCHIGSLWSELGLLI